MLGESLELMSFPCNGVLDIPWSNISGSAPIDVLDQLTEGDCKSSPATVSVIRVDVAQVDF